MKHVGWMIGVAAFAGLFAFTGLAAGQAQAPGSSDSSSSASKSNKASHKEKYSHANDFLIRGTVFNDKAMSFPGAELRIRRAGERKFRWHDSTNSRGEFAIRVPKGAEYEMVVHAKGFADQSKTFDGAKGLDEERAVFSLQRASEKK